MMVDAAHSCPHCGQPQPLITGDGEHQIEIYKSPRAVKRGGCVVTLAPISFILFDVLWERRRRLNPWEAIFDAVWFARGGDPDRNLVHHTISRLRVRLAPLDILIKFQADGGYQLHVVPHASLQKVA